MWFLYLRGNSQVKRTEVKELQNYRIKMITVDMDTVQLPDSGINAVQKDFPEEMFAEI